jgi:hypothetical protein
MSIVLTILLVISLIVNGLQWYRWHSYRSRPAGNHSYTGVMPALTKKQIDKNRKRRGGN